MKYRYLFNITVTFSYNMISLHESGLPIIRLSEIYVLRYYIYLYSVAVYRQTFTDQSAWLITAFNDHRIASFQCGKNVWNWTDVRFNPRKSWWRDDRLFTVSATRCNIGHSSSWRLSWCRSCRNGNGTTRRLWPAQALSWAWWCSHWLVHLCASFNVIQCSSFGLMWISKLREICHRKGIHYTEQYTDTVVASQFPFCSNTVYNLTVSLKENLWTSPHTSAGQLNQHWCLMHRSQPDCVQIFTRVSAVWIIYLITYRKISTISRTRR